MVSWHVRFRADQTSGEMMMTSDSLKRAQTMLSKPPFTHQVPDNVSIEFNVSYTYCI